MSSPGFGGAAGVGGTAGAEVGAADEIRGIAGVGIDAVEIARLDLALARTPSLVDRLFTASEQRDCVNADGTFRIWKLAARFAAKEAVAKAFGTGIDGFGFTDIEVVSNADGRPGVRLAPAAAAVAVERGIGALHLSLSHTHDLAFAQVVAEPARV